MRYLIAQDFHPRAGETVRIRAFPQPAAGWVAVTVELPQSKQRIVLRDERGLPLWRGGQRRAGGPPL